MLDFIEITSALGADKESNKDIESLVNWPAEEIFDKTGIKYRYISNSNQSAESLAIEAAKKIKKRNLDKIDLIISVSNTQSEDFPPISNHIHNFLELDPGAQCYGLNHGCSGFIDALQLVYSMFSCNLSSKALIVTADTYSKFIKKNDRSIRTLFSDGASCTILEKNTESGWILENKISNSQIRSQDYLKKNNGFISMNGPQVLLFSINTVAKNLIKIIPNDNCALFPHQAGKIVLNNLKSKMPDNVTIYENYRSFGNLVSTSIPNLLKDHLPLDGMKNIILSGFGVGLSHTSLLLNRR